MLDDLHISYTPNEEMQDFMKDLQKNMQIELSQAFIMQLQALLEFIAKYSVKNAPRFEREF